MGGEILSALDGLCGVLELEDAALLGVGDAVLVELTHFK